MPSLKCINYSDSTVASRRSPLPGKNPVPPPAEPGLIPAPGGTYTPGAQDGGKRSDTATLNKSDFHAPNTLTFLNKDPFIRQTWLTLNLGTRHGEAGACPTQICRRLGQLRSNEMQQLSRDQN